jgi:hypothetical protein
MLTVFEMTAKPKPHFNVFLKNEIMAKIFSTKVYLQPVYSREEEWMEKFTQFFKQMVFVTYAIHIYTKSDN